MDEELHQVLEDVENQERDTGIIRSQNFFGHHIKVNWSETRINEFRCIPEADGVKRLFNLGHCTSYEVVLDFAQD